MVPVLNSNHLAPKDARCMATALAFVLAFGLLAATHANFSSAQSFPSRPIRLVIPSPPGGGNDILGRLIAQKLSERIGQQTIAENRAGADGIIGTEFVVRSVPDGHTIMIVSTSFAMNPAIHKLPYDSIKSLTAISMIGAAPNVIFVTPGLSAKNAQELIALAKVKPGAVRFAWGGVTNRFGGELFNSMAGVKMTNVPYKGGGPAMVDVMGGLVEVGFGTLVQSLPHLRSGKLRALGVTSQNRSPLLPEMPTIAESGLPGYYDSVWFGLLGPAGMPGPVVNRLNAEVGAILKDPEMVKRLESDGAEPVIALPETFAKLIASDIEKWGRVAREAGIRTE